LSFAERVELYLNSVGGGKTVLVVLKKMEYCVFVNTQIIHFRGMNPRLRKASNLERSRKLSWMSNGVGFPLIPLNRM